MDPLSPIKRFDRFQQRHPPLSVVFATIKKFSDDHGGNLVTLVAYYSFLSVFPLLLVLVTILGFVLAGDPAFERSVRSSVLASFPVIGSSIDTGKLRGSTAALVIGVLGSLLSGLGVTASAQNAFNIVWEVPRGRRPNFFSTKLRGLILLIVLGVLFILGASASGIVSSGVRGLDATGEYAIGIAISLLLNFTVFMFSFQLLCSRQLSWPALIPGSALASILTTALQLLGGSYISHIAHTSSAYGTFALVLGVIAWLHLGATALIYSAELNSVLAGRAWPRSLFGPDNQVVPRRDGADERALDDARSLSIH